MKLPRDDYRGDDGEGVGESEEKERAKKLTTAATTAMFAGNESIEICEGGIELHHHPFDVPSLEVSQTSIFPNQRRLDDDRADGGAKPTRSASSSSSRRSRGKSRRNDGLLSFDDVHSPRTPTAPPLPSPHVDGTGSRRRSSSSRRSKSKSAGGGGKASFSTPSPKKRSTTDFAAAAAVAGSFEMRDAPPPSSAPPTSRRESYRSSERSSSSRRRRSASTSRRSTSTKNKDNNNNNNNNLRGLNLLEEYDCRAYE